MGLAEARLEAHSSSAQARRSKTIEEWHRFLAEDVLLLRERGLVPLAIADELRVSLRRVVDYLEQAGEEIPSYLAIWNEPPRESEPSVRPMSEQELLDRIDRYRTAVRDAKTFSAAAEEAYEAVVRDLEEAASYFADFKQLLETEREARPTAERHRDRFRHALWTYLQERDGIAGIHSPTPDTLRRIREILEEPNP